MIFVLVLWLTHDNSRAQFLHPHILVRSTTLGFPMPCLWRVGDVFEISEPRSSALRLSLALKSVEYARRSKKKNTLEPSSENVWTCRQTVDRHVCQGLIMILCLGLGIARGLRPGESLLIKTKHKPKIWASNGVSMHARYDSGGW